MLQEGHLVLISKVLADLTKRLPGHLKGLQGSAGRLADLFGRMKQEVGEDADRFAEILLNVERNIDLIAEKTETLNRLLQRMGSSPAFFDPKEIMEEAMLFSARLAHLHNVTIELQLDQNLQGLHNDPVSIHFLVSKIIQWMMTRMREGGELIVRASHEKAGLLIDVESEGHFKEALLSEQDPTGPFWPVAQNLIKELGGRLESDIRENPIKRISLFLPDIRALSHTQV